MQSVLNETIYFGITFAVRHMLVRVSQILVERFAEKTASLLRKQLIEAYFTLGARYVQTAGTGHLVTLSIEGIEKFKTYIELTIPKMIRSSIVPGLIVLYVLH